MIHGAGYYVDGVWRTAGVPDLPVPAVVLDHLDSLTEERDRARRVAVALEQELHHLRKQIEALHPQVWRPNPDSPSLADVGFASSTNALYPKKAVCANCSAPYPCPTLRLVQP